MNEELKACPPFKRFTRTYEDGKAWLPASGVTLAGNGEFTGPAIDRLALYESLLQMEPAEAALKLRRAAPENSRFENCHIYEPGENIGTIAGKCEVLIKGADLQKLVAAPENKPLTLEQLKRMNSDMINRPWVWVEANAELFDSKLVGPAYYQVQDGYKRDRAFCCGYPGLSFCLDYADYGKTWLSFARRPEESK